MTTLRGRIATAIALTSIGLVAAFGYTLYQASERLEFALARQLLSEELEALRKSADSGDIVGKSSRPGVERYVVRQAENEHELPSFLRSATPGFHELPGGDGREFHVGVETAGSTKYIVAYDIGHYEDVEFEFKALVVALAVAAAVCSLVLGQWLGRYLTRQLADLTASVSRADVGDLATMAHAGQEQEISILAGALDGYRQRIESGLERERAFTANVSHELRTPATAIRTTAELLAIEARDENVRTRAAQIMRLTDAMVDGIGVLLFLAREQAPQELEDVDVRELADHAMLPFEAELGCKPIAFENRLPRGLTAKINRQGLRIVLANLFSNAIRNTTSGHVRVYAEGALLVVSDSGPGISPDLLPHIFERRFRSGGDGLGLGLDIVRRVCDLLGWTVTVRSEVGRGTDFSLRIPGVVDLLEAS